MGHHLMGPRRRWYERYDIEPPFPWVFVGLCAIPILIIAAGVSVVIWHH